MKEDFVLVPLRGGAFLVDALKINPKKIIAIDCKRLPLKKKWHFAFGMRLNEDKNRNQGWKEKFQFSDFQNKHVRIVEACVVSGMTTIGFLTSFICHKVKPSLIEINAIGVSQQGVELVLKLAKKFGYKVKFIAGGLFYRLGNFYKSGRDELLTLDGKLVVGDIKKYLDLIERKRKKYDKIKNKEVRK